jgi:hypothetical protein
MVDTAVVLRPGRVQPAIERAAARSAPRFVAPAVPSAPRTVGDIFSEEWWLDAVTRGQFERIDASWDSMRVGTLYYHITRRGMVRKAVMPPYTRLMSPLLAPPGGQPRTRAANAVTILRDLYARLPNVDCYHTVVRCDPNVVFAYQLNGFSLGHKITFVSDAGVDIDSVFKGMDQKYRNTVRQGDGLFRMDQHADLDRFRRIRADSKRPDYNDYSALEALIPVLVSRGAGRLLSAVSECGTDQASALVVWDRERLYYLAAARCGGALGSKAATWLFYQAIAYAKRLGLAFDADGYATVASAQSLQRWGLPVSLNVNVSRGGLAYDLVKPIKDRLRPPPF